MGNQTKGDLEHPDWNGEEPSLMEIRRTSKYKPMHKAKEQLFNENKINRFIYLIMK